MGAEQAAKTMTNVTEAAMKRKTGEVDYDKLAAMEKIGYLRESDGCVHHQRPALDDGVIGPRETRSVLSYVLSVCRDAERRPLRCSLVWRA